MAQRRARSPRAPYWGCVLSGLLLASALGGARASSFRRWSSYVPKPVMAPCPQAANASKVPIGMWGCNGESWERSGPLNDWSFAGYGGGLEAIPDAPVTVDVARDFGAAGDGVQDDTAAVLAALNATRASGGVIFFPPGRYLLSNQLNISSNQVLRGAGRDLTTLHFNTSLQQLYGWGPNWVAGQEKSPYTWAGALISTQREKRLFSPSTLYLANVTRPAARGDTRLYVGGLGGNTSRADRLVAPGQWVALGMYETADADFAKALCNNRTDVGARLGPDFGNRQMLTHMSRVTAVGEDWLELERPLHVDVQPMFKPTIFKSSNFKVTGVGVEDMEISFPWTPYLGHHEEKGYNAIEFEAAVNSWVRRVRVVNADSAIKLYSSIFCTVSDVEVTTSPKPRRGGRWYGRPQVVQEADKDGHMAIALHWACFDNLVEKFNITALFYHELLVAGYSAHNVLTNGSGTDVCLDHHGGAPHNNLWTDIDLGSGLAAMRWSGAPQHFPFAGSNNVFWNIWASKIPVPYDYVGRLAASNKRYDVRQLQRMAKLPVMSRPASIQGYGQVVVDMPLDKEIPPIKEAGDWFIHYKPNQRVWPPNLYSAMVQTQARRLRLARQRYTLSQLTGQKLFPVTVPLTTVVISQITIPAGAAAAPSITSAMPSAMQPLAMQAVMGPALTAPPSPVPFAVPVVPKSGNGTAKPPSPKPANGTAKPPAPGPKPANGTAKPPSPKPANGTAKPPAPGPKPSNGTAKPPAPSPKPTVKAPAMPPKPANSTAMPPAPAPGPKAGNATAAAASATPATAVAPATPQQAPPAGPTVQPEPAPAANATGQQAVAAFGKPEPTPAPADGSALAQQTQTTDARPDPAPAVDTVVGTPAAAAAGKPEPTPVPAIAVVAKPEAPAPAAAGQLEPAAVPAAVPQPAVAPAAPLVSQQPAAGALPAEPVANASASQGPSTAAVRVAATPANRQAVQAGAQQQAAQPERASEAALPPSRVAAQPANRQAIKAPAAQPTQTKPAAAAAQAPAKPASTAAPVLKADTSQMPVAMVAAAPAPSAGDQAIASPVVPGAGSEQAAPATAQNGSDPAGAQKLPEPAAFWVSGPSARASAQVQSQQAANEAPAPEKRVLAAPANRQAVQGAGPQSTGPAPLSPPTAEAPQSGRQRAIATPAMRQPGGSRKH